MSFERRFELPNFDDLDIDLKCEKCKHKDYDFVCGEIGYCITDCGENYVVGMLLQEKGYGQVNIDWAWDPKRGMVPAVELYKNEAKKLMSGLEKLGHTCSDYHHKMQKNYLTCVIIDDGAEPISLCDEFLKLEAIK